MTCKSTKAKIFQHTHNWCRGYPWNYLCFMYFSTPMFAVVTFYLFQQCLKEKYCQCLFRMKFLRKQKERCQTGIHTCEIWNTRGHFYQLFLVMFFLHPIFEGTAFERYDMRYMHLNEVKVESCSFKLMASLLEGRNFIWEALNADLHTQRLQHFDIRAFQV